MDRRVQYVLMCFLKKTHTPFLYNKCAFSFLINRYVHFSLIDDDNTSLTSSQIKITDSLGASAAAGETAENAQEVLDMIDAQNKLRLV